MDRTTKVPHEIEHALVSGFLRPRSVETPEQLAAAVVRF
jgi:hypothetical protein